MLNAHLRHNRKLLVRRLIGVSRSVAATVVVAGCFAAFSHESRRLMEVNIERCDEMINYTHKSGGESRKEAREKSFLFIFFNAEFHSISIIAS